jgi:hypothetical protein
MGHPMAKKSFRKRGDKFLKHRNNRYGFNSEEEIENKTFHPDELLEEEYEEKYNRY